LEEVKRLLFFFKKGRGVLKGALNILQTDLPNKAQRRGRQKKKKGTKEKVREGPTMRSTTTREGGKI